MLGIKYLKIKGGTNDIIEKVIKYLSVYIYTEKDDHNVIIPDCDWIKLVEDDIKNLSNSHSVFSDENMLKYPLSKDNMCLINFFYFCCNYFLINEKNNVKHNLVCLIKDKFYKIKSIIKHKYNNVLNDYTNPIKTETNNFKFFIKNIILKYYIKYSIDIDIQYFTTIL
jgi:hypothetical protein